MERFIGLDVHAASTTCAVIDARGKRVRVDVVETNGQALIEFLKLQPGTLRALRTRGAAAASATVRESHGTGAAKGRIL